MIIYPIGLNASNGFILMTLFDTVTLYFLFLSISPWSRVLYICWVLVTYSVIIM